jgi:hypothetical protein
MGWMIFRDLFARKGLPFEMSRFSPWVETPCDLMALRSYPQSQQTGPNRGMEGQAGDMLRQSS